MKRLKLILGAVAVLLVAALVAGYAALASLELESYRGTIERRAEAATGRQLELTGPMHLAVDFSPAITVEGMRFANAEWGSRAAMATVARFELEVALLPLIGGDIVVRRLVLSEPDILLETGGDGRGNWVLHPQAAGPQEDAGTPRMPSFESVLIEDGRLTYRDGQTGEQLKLALERATLRRNADGDLSVEVDGGYQDVPFGLTGTIGQLERLLAGTGRYPVDLELAAADSRIAMNGALDQTTSDLRPDLDVRIAGGNLADLNPLLQAKLPDAGPFELKARVRGEEKGYVISGVQASLGDSDLSGEATLKLTGPRPALFATFKAARLDLPGLLPAAARSGDGDAARLFPDTRLPFEVLRRVDADVELDAGTLHLADGVTANEVSLAIVLEAGRLQVEPLRGEIAGGAVNGNLTLDAGGTPARVGLNLRVEALDYGRLLRTMQVSDRIAGTIGGSADLTGAGASPHEIAASLDGALEVVGGEGRVAAAALSVASAGLGKVLAPWREDRDGIRINCVVARFDVAEGVARSRVILADTEDITLGGEGSIDLGKERYDLRFLPEAKQTSLASLAVPIRVKGPLSDPEVGPDTLGAAKAGAVAIGSLVNPLVALGTVATLIVESETADQNPCVAALEKASGRQPDGDGDGDSSGGLGGLLEGLSDSIDKQLDVQGDDGENDPTVLQDRGR